jgi:Zn-dependent membrane protease YugP
MVRLVVSAIYAANLTFVASMIGIAVTVASGSMAARIGTLSLFLLGAGMLLFGLATMVVEISGSDRAVRLEVRQILAIEYRPATTPGAGPASVPRDEGSRGAEPAR